MADFININDYACCKLEEDFLLFKWSSGKSVDLATAKDIIKVRNKITENLFLPCLIDLRGIGALNISKEARDYFSKGEAVRGIKSIAILIDNSIMRILSNVYITFSKPEVPTKIFTDKDKAVAWIKGLA